MKRLHVHVAVADIERSTRFYSSLFGAAPTIKKDDYVKWLLDDPRVNFAISSRGREPGLDHLGIQAENEEELKEVSTRLRAADMHILDEGTTTCCYAKSDKAWVVDPQGIAWEAFFTSGPATTYGDGNPVSTNEVPTAKKSPCCAPTVEIARVETKRE